MIGALVTSVAALLFLAAGMDWALAGDVAQSRRRRLPRQVVLGFGAALFLLISLAVLVVLLSGDFQWCQDGCETD